MARAAAMREEPVTVTCATVDEARRHCAAVYFPHRLDVLDDARPFDMRLRAVTFGPVTVGVLSYSDPVYIETGDMETAYEVNVPLSGEVECWSDPDRVVASVRRAVIFRPEGRTSMRGFGEGRPLLGVKLNRVALEGQLAELTGIPVRAPLDVASQLDLTKGRGRGWWAVARSVVELFRSSGDGPALLDNSLVMRPLMQSLLAGLLVAADHPFLQQVLQPAEPSVPAVVRRAQDFVADHAAEALSVTDIARATGMSVRGLQATFRHHLQTTPMEYVRDVRLRKAHVDLVLADPGRTTVAEVAYRWGFAHPGRFAARHRAVYGTSPSAALGSDH